MTNVARTRDQGEQSPALLSYEAHGYGPAPYTPISGSLETGSQLGTYKVIHDVRHTGFRKTRDTAKWVSSPASIYALETVTSQASATTRNVPDSTGSGIERTWSGDGVGYILGALCPYTKSVSFGNWPDLVNVSNLQQLATVECLNRINPAAAQTWVTVAESHKTVDQILLRARKLALAFYAAREGNVKALERMFPGTRTKRYPKRVVVWDERGLPIVRRSGKPVARYGHKKYKESARFSDRVDRLWLEYRYGWCPLVYDIVDELKAIYAQNLRDDLLQKDFTAVFGLRRGRSLSSSNFTTPSFGGGKWNWRKDETHEVSVRAYAKYTVDAQAGLLNRLNDFGAFDVPRAIWELVPYSFVVDWFTPIGTWLGALTPKVGVKVIDSGLVTRTTKSGTRTLTGYVPDSVSAGGWPNPPYPLQTSDGFAASSMERQVTLTVPLVPPHEPNLGFNRLVDAVALLKAAR